MENMDKTRKLIIRPFKVRHPDLASPEIWELFDRARSGDLSAQRRFAQIVLLPMTFFHCSHASRWYKMKKLFDIPLLEILLNLLRQKVDGQYPRWFKRASIINLRDARNLSSVVHYFVQTLVRNEYRAKIRYIKTFEIIPVKGDPDQDTQARIFLNKDGGEPEEYYVDLDTGQDYEQQPETKLDRRVLKSLSVGDRALCEGYYRASLPYIQQQAKTLPQKEWKAIPQKDYCKSIGADPTALSRAIRHYKEIRAGNYYYVCPNRKWGVGGDSEMRPKTTWHGGSVQPCWLHPSELLLVKGREPWKPSYRVIAVGRSKHYPAGNRKEPWKVDLKSHHGDKKWGYTFHKMQVRVRDPEMMLVHHLDRDCRKQYCRKWGCRYCWAGTKQICKDGPACLSVFTDELAPAPKPYHQGAILLHDYTKTYKRYDGSDLKTIHHVNLGRGTVIEGSETEETISVKFGRAGTITLRKNYMGITWKLSDSPEAPGKHISQDICSPSPERLIDFAKVHPSYLRPCGPQITTKIEKDWLTDRDYRKCPIHFGCWIPSIVEGRASAGHLVDCPTWRGVRDGYGSFVRPVNLFIVSPFYAKTCPFCKPLGSSPKTGNTIYHLFPIADRTPPSLGIDARVPMLILSESPGGGWKGFTPDQVKQELDAGTMIHWRPTEPSDLTEGFFYDSPAFPYRVQQPGQTHLPRDCVRKKSKPEIVPEVVEFREDEPDIVITS